MILPPVLLKEQAVREACHVSCPQIFNLSTLSSLLEWSHLAFMIGHCLHLILKCYILSLSDNVSLCTVFSPLVFKHAFPFSHSKAKTVTHSYPATLSSSLQLLHLEKSFIPAFLLDHHLCFSTSAAAKLLQSCLDSVRPHRQQPTRLLCPWNSPGKNTGVGCRFLLHLAPQSTPVCLCPSTSPIKLLSLRSPVTSIMLNAVNTFHSSVYLTYHLRHLPIPSALLLS